MKFENARGDYHTKVHSGGPSFPPKGASPGWPNFRCKNSCGFNTPPDSSIVICPNCHAPLIRWIRYEEKQQQDTDRV